MEAALYRSNMLDIVITATIIVNVCPYWHMACQQSHVPIPFVYDDSPLSLGPPPLGMTNHSSPLPSLTCIDLFVLYQQ